RRAGPRAIESFPAETQQFMKNGLHQFSRGDPEWETTRAKWIAMGPDEADLLVECLWAGLLKAQAMGQPKLVEKARYELSCIGHRAHPLRAESRGGGTVYTVPDQENGGRRDIVVDDFTRREASEILGLIGEPAVGAVRDALRRSTSKSGRRRSIQT